MRVCVSAERLEIGRLKERERERETKRWMKELMRRENRGQNERENKVFQRSGVYERDLGVRPFGNPTLVVSFSCWAPKSKMLTS